MDVFLTGATGYIGGAIADALLRAGHGVLGLARSDQVAEDMQARSISPMRGDLRDAASLTRGAQQADAVIQAGTTNSSDMDQVDSAAVDAMLLALEGTSKPFIYTSGCWVLGNTGDIIADEEAPTDPPSLVAWRPALERRVLAASTRGIRSVVIRPAVVYGRGGGTPAMLINLARKSGAARYIGSGEQHSPMVQVDDLADLYVRALAKAPAGSLFNAPGGPTFRFKEIAQAISQPAGLGGRTESWSLEAAREVLGPLADALALDLQFSGDKAKRVLGWTPRASSVIDDLVNGSYRLGMPSSV
ncbi:MAG TPA: SDR family oxidoreductase [Ktedonobacterales bacterium]|nr:SDR family oxidoreductase [Ktedonobacterales bacterium]